MNYTINEIPDEAVELSGNEMIPIWQGETKKVSVATLAGYVQDSASYSTTETLTGGTWIDGKPIYRRVLEFNNFSCPYNTYVTLIKYSDYNIDRVIRWWDSPIDVEYYLGDGLIYVESSDDKINLYNYGSGGSTILLSFYFIIEYTKTSS